MPLCSNGHEVEEGARFCRACGAEVVRRRCTNGHDMPDHARFCAQCGAEGTTPPSAAAPPRVVAPPPRPYRSVRALSLVAIGALAIRAAASLVAAQTAASRLGLLDRIRDGRHIVPGEIFANDQRYARVTAIVALVVLLAGLAWLMWLYRAYENLTALGETGLRFTPGWAIGWWFIPFANFVMPYKVMRELWQRSEPQPVGPHHVRSAGGTLVPLWWVLWIATGVGLIAGITIVATSPLGAPNLRARAMIQLISEPFLLVTGLLAIAIVHTITRHQDERAPRM